jgi:hypothetical protein
MRKNKRPPTKQFTDIENLTTSLISSPLSWTPSIANKQVNPNYSISVDWGIINKKHKTGVNNVFALFLDTLTGLVFVFPAESRGQADLALETYIKQYGKPQIIIHDNATEFVDGEFAQICTTHNITQQRSTPYEPNQNPVELYMDIITSMARSMLFISGLNLNTF